MGYTAGSIALISLVEQPPTKQQFWHQPAALQVARVPHIPGVCDEGEGGSITRIEVDYRKGRASQFLLQLDLLELNGSELFFVDRDKGRLGCGQQPVQELLFLALDVRQLAFQRGALVGHAALPIIAGFLHHKAQHRHNLRRGAQVVEQRFEFAFDLLSAHRLAAMGAALGLAEIIGVLAVAPLRPRCRHRALAISALHEAAQWEVIAHIFAHESAFRPTQTFQYAPMRFVSDERLMLALHERNVPSRNLDIASIDGVLQHLPNALFVDARAAPIEEARILIEVVFDFHLGDEPPGCEAFQHLADNGRGLWIGHEYFAPGLGFFIAIANRRLEDPKAVEHAGAHLLAYLSTVLLALKLRLRGDHGFDELAFRGILEAEVQALARGVAQRHFLTELQVEDGVARITLQVIEYDNVRAICVLIEIPQQPHHAGALYEVAAAAHIIGEHRRDGVAAISRIIAAAAFLRDQALPVRCLFLAGYAAVDDGLGCVVVLAHVAASFSCWSDCGMLSLSAASRRISSASSSSTESLAAS